MRSYSLLFLCGLWVNLNVILCSESIIAQDTLSGKPPTEAQASAAHEKLDKRQIAKFIVDLDSDEFKVRESAFQSLLAGAKGNPEPLVKVTIDDSASFEVRTRCLKVLRRWAESATDQEREAIAKVVGNYPPTQYPDSRELKLLREYYLLDLSTKPELIIDRLKAGGIQVESNSEGIRLFAHEWTGTRLELGYLRQLNTEIQLHTSPGFLELAMKHLVKANVVEMHVSRKPTKDRGFRVPGAFATEKISDGVMSLLPELSNLRRFDTSFVSISDQGFEHLGLCKELEFLQLAENVNDENIEFVKNCKKLKTLIFHNAFQMKGPGLKHLAGSLKLEKLELFFTSIEGKYLKHLVELPNLKELYLPQTNMSDVGMEFVAQIKSLMELKLDNTHVTNRGLAQIRELPRLRSIDLVSGSFSNAGVMQLTSLPELRSVRVGGGMITRDIVSLLEKKGATFKTSGQYFKPNSAEEYIAIEKLLASGMQVNQYARPDNLTLFIYPESWQGAPEALQEIQHLKGIKHLRLNVYGALDDKEVEQLIQLDGDLEVQLFPDKNQTETSPRLTERLKKRFNNSLK